MKCENCDHSMEDHGFRGCQPGLHEACDCLMQYRPASGSARDSQVGGSHYSRHEIQPWDVVDEYGLDFYAGNVLKYLLRAGRKGSRVEDLKKARHYLGKLIEIEEGGE